MSTTIKQDAFVTALYCACCLGQKIQIKLTPVLPAGARAGLISTPVFTNGSAGAQYVASNGKWLDVPDAVLFAASGSSNKAILISLQDPIYNKEDKVCAQINCAMPLWLFSILQYF